MTNRQILTQVERIIAQHSKGNPFVGYRQLSDARDAAERIYFRASDGRTSDRAQAALGQLDSVI